MCGANPDSGFAPGWQEGLRLRASASCPGRFVPAALRKAGCGATDAAGPSSEHPPVDAIGRPTPACSSGHLLFFFSVQSAELFTGTWAPRLWFGGLPHIPILQDLCPVPFAIRSPGWRVASPSGTPGDRSVMGTWGAVSSASGRADGDAGGVPVRCTAQDLPEATLVPVMLPESRQPPSRSTPASGTTETAAITRVCMNTWTSCTEGT
jgi:hypothetical protein